MWALNRGGNEYPIVPNQICERFKLHANGGNIVIQQLPTLLAVICCVRLHTLLHVVACCCAKFETGQTFSYVQTDATSCCVRLYVSLSVLRHFDPMLTSIS